MPIRHSEWRVRSNQVIKFSSYNGRSGSDVLSSPKWDGEATGVSSKLPLKPAVVV